jgi:malonate transporter
MMLFTLLLPLFLLGGLGALISRHGWASGVNALAARLLIPALLFNGTYKHGLPADGAWQMLIAYYGALLLLMLGVGVILRRHDDKAARALGAVYSNTVFVGVPVLGQVWGEGSLHYAYPLIAFHGLIGFTAYYLMAAGSKRIVEAVTNTVMNPIVISLMAGLALNLAGISLPAAITTVLNMLAAAALPCALLALGASLAAMPVPDLRAAGWVVAAKLLALPAMVYLAAQLLKLPPDAARVLVVIAACPVGVNVAAVVQGDGKDPALSNSAIFISSLVCMATIPFWLSVL